MPLAGIFRKWCLLGFRCLKEAVRRQWPGTINFIWWVFCYGTLAAIAARQIIPLAEDYANNNYAVQGASVLAAPETYPMPTLTLCLPYNTEDSMFEILNAVAPFSGLGANCSICDQLQANGWDVWVNTTWMDDNFDNKRKIQNEFVKKLFSTVDADEDELNFLKNPWKRPIFDSAWSFLSEQVRIDTDFLYAKVTTNQMFNFSETSPEKLRKLFSLVASSICLGGDVPGTTASCNADNLQQHLNNSFMVFHNNGLCFQVPTIEGAYSFSIKTDSLFVQPTGELAAGSVELYETDIESLLFRLSSPLTTTRTYVTLYRSALAPGTIELEHRILTRQIDGIVGSDCYKQSSQSACVLKCKLDVISKSCHCVPFTFAGGYLKRLLPFCTHDQYTNCWNNIAPGLDSCEKVCDTHPCDLVLYQWTQLSAVNKRVPGFTVRLIPVYSWYQEYSRVIKNSLEQFLSQVQGALSSIFDLLIFFIPLKYLMATIIARLKRHRQVQPVDVELPNLSDPVVIALGDLRAEVLGLKSKLSRLEHKHGELLSQIEERIGGASSGRDPSRLYRKRVRSF